jgi:hypothetical protein
MTEYKVVKVLESRSTHIEQMLNEHAKEGWLLKESFSTTGGSKTLFRVLILVRGT